MPSPLESPLNPFPALRYDGRHDGDSDEANPSLTQPSPPPQAGADMDVNRLGSIANTSFFKTARTTSAAPKPEARALNPKDTVEISSAARSDSTAKPSLRAERLARIKAEIDAGTYDTPERLEAAMERMFSSLGLGE